MAVVEDKNKKVPSWNERAGYIDPNSPAPLVQDYAQKQAVLNGDNNNGQSVQAQNAQQAANNSVITTAPVSGTPVRDRKIGFDVNERVNTATANNAAPNVFSLPVRGKFEVNPDAQPKQEEKEGHVTDFTNMPAQPIGWNEDGTPVYAGKDNKKTSSGTPTLSDVLQRQQQGKKASTPVPEFKKDGGKGDGGFFGWLGKAFGNLTKKKGMRPGETEDDYDERITRNKERLAVLADAMRHMGNIYHTTQYAPSQTFNSPTDKIESDLRTRKAERAARAKMDADNARKQQEMDMKRAAAEADKEYKDMTLNLKREAAKRAAEKDAANKKYKDDYFAWQKDEADKRNKRQAEQDKQKQKNWQATFDENKRHHTASERISASKGRSGRGRSGGSGNKYWFEDKDGKIHYQPNKTMWEQEYYREYGELPKGKTSTSSSTKSIDPKTGNETTVTTRKEGVSLTSQAAEEQNKARAVREQAARQKQEAAKKAAEAKKKEQEAAKKKKQQPAKNSKPAASKPHSNNGYKHTKALGL